MPLAARLIACSTTFGGAAVVLFAALSAAGLPGHTTALLAAAAILTELMQVAEEDGVRPGEETSFSFSSGVLVAAVIVLGPLRAALIVPPALALVDELRGAPRRATAFNAAGSALAAFAAGSAFVLAGGTVGAVVLPRQLPQLVLLAGVAYAVNLLLVESLVSTISGRRLRDLVAATARGQVLSATSEAGFGVALAYFLVDAPWATLTLAPLVIGVYMAHARLALQRRETQRALETFANVVDERDAFTAHHSLRVAQTVEAFAEWLGRSPEDAARLRWAGRLHDLGKITVDSAILHKPARLTDEEWEAMRAHPRLSARLLRRFSLAGDEARAVELHHERFDGSGYYGVGADRIPLAAHLLAVADSFDAITNDRPYRRRFTAEEALVEIERCSGTQFHPTVARAFVAFKRGLAPRAALTGVDLAQLDALWRTRSDPAPTRFRRPGASGITVALTLLTVAAAGVGATVLAAAAGAAAVVVGACVVAGHERTRRLTNHVLGKLADDDLDGAVAVIAATTPVRFAALVPPAPTGAAPVIVHGASPDDGPPAWLASIDLDSSATAIRTLETEGYVVTVPIGEPERVHLVVQFEAEPPPSVRDALRRSVAGFRSLSLDLAPPAQRGRRLSAIA